MKEIKLGDFNSGNDFDKQRAPEGMAFQSNIDPDNVRVEFFKKYPEKYTFFDTAYTADGHIIPGQLAVFEKIEPKTK